ncbi:siroheme synthase [Cristinia sonorae]|uniref:precorrin-2 dehydrogenase n=1 Tax=Cristinia sonorae TaxID=1940300 RepID=A0A8K0UTN1_9AGAR|nr:siroheme synthase [Cristinia sonorae]
MPPSVATFSGGSVLLAWQLKDKTVLIVGGGDVASGRIESVLVADAFITLVAPSTGLHPLTRKYLTESDRITYHDRMFAGPQDLDNVDMVLTAIDDVEKSREICAMCRERRIPVNVADIPPSCDFYFGSQIRSGPLQIMISTNGQSPKLANIIRRKIEEALPEHAGEAVEKVGELRNKLRTRAPGVGGELGKRRMRWMVDVCNAWDIEDLAALDGDLMNRLLDDGWEKNKVPKPEDIGSGKRRHSAVLSPSSSLSGSALPLAIGFIAGIAATAAILLAPTRR